MDSLRKKIYFASDAHLGARFHKDPLAVEKRLVRWLDSIKDEAMAIYFLGDMFDYWYEYKYVVPKGFVRFLGKLAELSDNGVEIHIFIGNSVSFAPFSVINSANGCMRASIPAGRSASLSAGRSAVVKAD